MFDVFCYIFHFSFLGKEKFLIFLWPTISLLVTEKNKIKFHKCKPCPLSDFSITKLFPITLPHKGIHFSS